MSKDSSLPISFHTNSFLRIIVLLVDKNADNNYPKHTFHKVTAESKPLWAELPMSTRIGVLTVPLAPLMGTSLPVPVARCLGRIAIMKMNLITEKLA